MEAASHVAQVADGFSDDQQFFLALAQAWYTGTGPPTSVRGLYQGHAPAAVRVNGMVRNLPAFHAAFGCQPGQRLRPPEPERCRFW